MSEDCGMMIKKINDCLKRDANNDMRKYGVTVSQVGVLTILGTAGGEGMPLKRLEEQLHVKQPTAAGIIRRLSEGGMLEYLQDPSDRRAKYVRITEKGRDVLDNGVRQMAEAENKLLAPLSEEETEVFRRCLAKICASFT